MLSQWPPSSSILESILESVIYRASNVVTYYRISRQLSLSKTDTLLNHPLWGSGLWTEDSYQEQQRPNGKMVLCILG